MRRFKLFLNDDNGATAIEYGLTALLISVVAILAMTNTGSEVNGLYTTVEGSISDAAPGG